MMRRRGAVLWPLLILAICSTTLSGIDIRDTRMLSQPAVSRDKVAFVYGEDLWISSLDGGNALRLTSNEGVESNPFFSPDGKWLAFSGQYDGNTDVYLVSSEGGIPVRLTWHPGTDLVRGFTPDGKSVLFRSSRSTFTFRHSQFFTVPVEGGWPRQLEIPHGDKGAFSPDGRQMAYTPLGERFGQWKNYRGGTATRIWIFDFDSQSVTQIPQPEGRCNDTDPIWLGSKVFFRSDRNGEFNIFSYDTRNQRLEQITKHDDFPVLDASGGSGSIVYEQAGYIHLLDPDRGSTKRLKIGVPADLAELRPRFVKGNQYIRAGSLSPSGARAAFEFRGEVVTVPREKGDPRNLTNTPDVHERSPVWSPDGSSIAYFSDEGGEYQLHIRHRGKQNDVRRIKVAGHGFYDRLVWSPDSKKISYADNSQALYWLDLESGKSRKIAAEPHYGPFPALQHTWSPDSKWLIYTVNSPAYIQTVHAYSIEDETSRQVTDGLSEVSDPVFDASGKYLYFFGSTEAGPAKHWFAQSGADLRPQNFVYLAVLRNDEPSPLMKESDEEKMPEPEEDASEEEPSATTENDENKKEKEKTDDAFRIDFDGLDQRILALPIPEGNYSSLAAGKQGQIYFLSAPPETRGPFGPAAARTTLKQFDLKSRDTKEIMVGVSAFTLSEDSAHLLYFTGQMWGIAALSDKINPASGKIGTDRIQVKIEPRSEWPQIFNEAWRINRDYFYDPGFHGADWPAMREKYAPFLPHLAVRSDLNRLIQWMCSELAVGHHGVGGGDRRSTPEQIAGGLLGADYSIENGRYRFARIYGGLNWNPELRSPLTEPGVGVQVGDYLISVNGVEVRSDQNLYSFFEATADQIVQLEVADNPEGADASSVQVVPISNEVALRNRAWVEGNRQRVDEATGGRVAYVYVPNTAGSGHTYFKRYFFPQSNKDAIIVDERFNGGGQVADYYIDILRRPLVSYWATRYGEDIRTPSAAILGPKVMLIDETAGSGGDLLPWMFRKFELGTLIGRRTWGGLVGVLGFPILMDGGRVTAPNLAIWTEDGFIVENVGVPPDIEVEQWPSEVIAGRDPQLEKAIEVILQQLNENPPAKPKRPPFPIRVRQR